MCLTLPALFVLAFSTPAQSNFFFSVLALSIFAHLYLLFPYLHFHTPRCVDSWQDYDRDNYSSKAEVSTADRRSSPNVSVSVETRRTSPYDDVEPRRSEDFSRRRSSASGGGGRTTVEIGRASMSGETVEETARRMSTTGRRASASGTFLSIPSDSF